MRKVELKIHPGKIYEVHEKEFTDLVNLKMISRVVEEEDDYETVDRSDVPRGDDADAIVSNVPEVAPVKKRTTTRKTSPKNLSE